MSDQLIQAFAACGVQVTVTLPPDPLPTLDEYAEYLRLFCKRENGELSGDEAPQLKELAKTFEPKLTRGALEEIGSKPPEERSADEKVAWDWALRRTRGHRLDDPSCPPVAELLFPRRPRASQPRSRSEHRPSSRRRTSRRTSGTPPREPDDDPPLAPLPRRVPADRLAALILRQLDSGDTADNLAFRSGVPARRFRSILNGGQVSVSFSVADRIVTYALDGPVLWLGELADLYEGAL